MRKAKVTLLLLLLYPVIACSQEQNFCSSGKKGMIMGNVEISALNSLRNKGVAMHGYELGVDLFLDNGIGICGETEILTYHDRRGNSTTYGNAFGFSGGLCCHFLDKRMAIKALVGKSNGGSDYKNNFYETRLNYLLNIPADKYLHVSVGVGYRYSVFAKEGMSNHGFPFFTVGFGI